MPRARAVGPARMVAGALVALSLLAAAARPGPSSADVGSSTVGSAQLNGIALLPGGGAWAVGQGGTIAYSADGSSWTVNTTAGVVGNLNAVVAVDDQLALAVTDHGTVVRTVDGATWSAQTDVSAVAVKLNGVAVGASRVWAVGQVDPVQTTPMFISSDGGATWSAYLAVSPDADLYGIAAVRDADDTLYAVGDNGHIYKKTAADPHWSTLRLSGPNLRAVSAPSASVAWAVGASGTVLLTTDGSAWSPTQGALPSTEQLTGVAALSATTAWVTSAAGTLYYTEDAGLTWQTLYAGSNALRAVAARSATDAIAVGNNGLVLRISPPSAGTTTPSPSASPMPSATLTPSASPSATSTPSPLTSATPTPSPPASATSTPSPPASATPTPSPSPSATSTPSPSPSATWTPSPSASATATRTPTLTRTPTPTATSTGTATRTPTATVTPTFSPRAPGAPTVVLSSVGSLVVSWTRPAGADATLVGYEVWRYPVGSSTPDDVGFAGIADTQLILDPAMPGSFTFTVSAIYDLSAGRQLYESPHSARIDVQPTATATPTVTITPTTTPTPTSTPSASATRVPSPTRTPSPSSTTPPTSTWTPDPDAPASPTPSPTATPSASPSPGASATATVSPTPSTWVVPIQPGVATVIPVALTAVPSMVPTPDAGLGGVAALIPTTTAGAGPTRAIVLAGASSPFLVALDVPIGATPIAVRVQPVSTVPAFVTVPPDLALTKIVAVDVFDPGTGELIHRHSDPPRLVLGLDPAELAVCRRDPSLIAVLHLDASGQVTRLPTTVDCEAGTVTADLAQTSHVAVAVLARGSAVTFRTFLPRGSRRGGAP